METTRLVQIIGGLIVGLLAGYGGAQYLGSGGETSQPAAVVGDGTQADWRASLGTLRIGITGSERDSQRMGRLDEFTAHISQRLGVPVTFVQASDYAGVTQAMASSQIEMAITGASNYASMWEETKGNVEPLLVNRESDGSSGYYAALFVRSDSPYTKLDDLAGKSIVYPDANSTSGYLFPRYKMRERGIDPDTFFGKSGFGGGHPQAVVAVLQKQYDAGLTWVSGQGDPTTGYTRGNLRLMVDAGQINMADLRVIELFGKIPNGPFVIRKDVPQEAKDILRGVLVALHVDRPELYEAISQGGGAGFEVVPHSFFDVIIKLREEEKAARRG